MYQTILCHIRRSFTGYEINIFLVLINLVHLTFRDLQIKSAQIINNLNHRSPVHTGIVFDIQVKIGIQHLYRLFRTTMCICSIRLMIRSVANAQIRVTINGNKLDILCFVIDTCNHDHIRITGIIIVGTSVIQTKQGNIRISFQRKNRIFIQITIDSSLGFIQILVLDPVHHADKICCQKQDCQKQYLKYKQQKLLAFLLLSSFSAILIICHNI